MDVAHFKGRLEDEKRTLEAELASVGRANPAVPGDFDARATETGQEPDSADEAVHLDNYQENAAVLHELEIRYDEVLAALVRIEEGTYGVCATDGKPMAEARLESNPAAATCTAHST